LAPALLSLCKPMSAAAQFLILIVSAGKLARRVHGVRALVRGALPRACKRKTNRHRQSGGEPRRIRARGHPRISMLRATALRTSSAGAAFYSVPQRAFAFCARQHKSYCQTLRDYCSAHSLCHLHQRTGITSSGIANGTLPMTLSVCLRICWRALARQERRILCLAARTLAAGASRLSYRGKTLCTYLA